MLADPRPFFSDLDDPRRNTKNKLHSLHDILMIVLCSVLSGVEDWVGMQIFAESREDWFRQFLTLANGIPSHDTLSDVMGRLDHKAFAEAFMDWVHHFVPSLEGHQVCVDGKTLRGSREQGQSTVHMVSAFAAQARVVLGHQAVAEKTNEIKAIPDLLALLDLQGAVVSIDAMGCQKEIAKAIVDQGADYVLALKDNHPTLSDDVQLWLNQEYEAGRLTVEETVEKDHGRIEERRYALSADVDWLGQKTEWTGLRSVGMVDSVRHINGQISHERRFYLCSFTKLDRFAQSVRQHWLIENAQHWVLDVQFHEDSNRARKDHSAKNLATVRRMALNIIRMNDPNSKRSVRQRRNMCAFNDSYRQKIIMGTPKS